MGVSVLMRLFISSNDVCNTAFCKTLFFEAFFSRFGVHGHIHGTLFSRNSETGKNNLRDFIMRVGKDPKIGKQSLTPEPD